MNRHLIPILIAIFLPLGVAAQRPSGTISGRVVTDDGQPLPAARITIIGAGSTGRNFQGRAMILTDEEGNFKAEGLDPMPYRLFASAPGYVHIGGDDFSSSPVMGAVSNAPYRVGDFVSITMTRGAVITGRVLTSAGEPVVGINVRAIRVRDQTGRPVHGDTEALSFNNKTDDRGIYRIYGLAAGSYIVVAGGGAFSAFQTPYDARVPVYHPSATRDTASELTVRNGEEFSGADIRYRSERGFVISGRVTGATASARTSTMNVSLTSIMLRHNGNYISSTFIPPNSEGGGFAFYGIPPGEYELEASRSGPVDDDPFISEPRKVVVSGVDVTGVNLPLVAAASIAGSVAIESPEEKGACEGAREFIIEEFQLMALRNATGDAEKDRNALISSSNTPSPDKQGAFRIRGLRADHYRIIVSLPSDGLYLKSMAFDKPGRLPSRDGLILKAGERVTGLKITAAHGAASLSGKVESVEGKSEPLHAYLVPQEAESKDDVLRYYEVAVEGREFKFTNLAPGKYRLVFKAGGKVPLAWNPVERAALRKEAETTERMVELKSCQQLTN